MDIPLWERQRHWPLMRPFVYYLTENFIESAWVTGKRVVDFSAGLGDLSSYMAGLGPTRLIATVPEPELANPAPIDGVEWRPGVLASHIAESLEPDRRRFGSTRLPRMRCVPRSSEAARAGMPAMMRSC